MLSLAPIIALLKPQTTAVDKWFRSIGNDFDYVNADSASMPPRTAFVLPKADKSTAADENSDEIEVTFEVVIVLDQPVKRNDGKADDEMRSFRKEVYKRLRGKKPSQGCSRILYVGGHLVRETTRDVMWAETYKFSGPVDAYTDNPPLFESVEYQGANT